MKYYLTTPIYYVNAAPHIGHTYTTIVADLVRRFKAMQGYEAVLTTGTDEHGQKVERSARAAGKSPEEFTTIIAEEFRRQWEKLGLKIDRFQRTTDPRHHRVVQDLFARCLKNGYIYKSAYTGQYCFFDEYYASEAKPGDPCPDCGRPTETVTEENLFFKLSAFTEKLIELHEKNPDFLQPETRRNEVLSFLRQGLNDLSISRTTIKWGIPVPDYAPHVFYVWFDALTTYKSAVEGQQAGGEDLWPADLHLIGKEIVRFHAIYWPAFLMAAGLPLPKRIYAHGWLLFESDKMSKSRGNIVRATPIAEVAGIDALRYFLLREIVFGQDGSFSYDALVGRYNADLAHGLGNLASRTLTMIRQYRGGVIPAAEGDAGIAAQAREAIDSGLAAFERFEFSKGLETIWSLLAATDKYIVEQAPWKLSKEPEAAAELDATLYTAAEVVRIATALLAPVIPDSAASIWAQLGMSGALEAVRLDRLRWGQLAGGQKIGEIAAVFPRIDPKVAIPRMRELEVAETARQAALVGQAPAPPEEEPATAPETITIDDFARVDMRVGKVLEAQLVKGASKLVHMTVDIGQARPRSIVAGIAEAYKPEDLVGRAVVIVANLQPRTLRGIPSEGMIVAASLEGGRPVLVGFHEDVPAGARLK
jgi:methionyl-tRNA synthetase